MIKYNVPLLIDFIKRKLDAGEEILILKHQYDLNQAEVEQVLSLYEMEKTDETKDSQ